METKINANDKLSSVPLAHVKKRSWKHFDILKLWDKTTLT